MRLKHKSKFTWEGWKSRGNEPQVFSVEHPCELIGTHAKLIDAQLGESEKIEYCLYSPRVSSTTTPFGLKVKESSCGLCITDKRFIISRDRHINNVEARVDSIRLDDILYFNIGKALLLGWFSITYSQGGRNNQESILFCSTGKNHFERVIRSYKKYWNGFDPDEHGLESFSLGNFIHRIQNKSHAECFRTLVSSGEKCLLSFPCKYLCVRYGGKRFFFRQKQPQYFLNDATCFLTNKALLLARDSLGGGIEYGIDVLLIPFEKVKAVDILEEQLKTKVVHRMKIFFKNGLKEESLEMPLVADIQNIKFMINVFKAFLRTSN